MCAKGGCGADVWRARAGQAAGLLVLAGLVGLFLWFRAANAKAEGSAPDAEAPSTISLYFTEPGPGAASSSAPSDALIEAILRAQDSVDMAVYELDLAPVADALLAVRQRGVRVRIVAESDQAGWGELPRLESAGVPVVLDRRPSLMHDKFTVIDNREVWTGSMNYTSNGVRRNNNNLVRLQSTEVARRFTQEFEEMFLQDRFSALSLGSDSAQPVSLTDASVEVYFSPDDHPARRLVQLIESASAQIDFLAFSFTSEAISDALVERLAVGVSVRGVIEADQAAGAGSQYDRLRAAGVDVRLDGNPGRMHHKVIVIDGVIVITGSYNFSRSAETTNDENLIVIRSADVGRAFEGEVDRLYADGLP